MTKNSYSSSKHTFLCQVMPVLAVVLFFGFALLAYKHAKMKNSWQNYAVQTLQSSSQQRSKTATEDAQMLALTVGQYPVALPLYKQPRELQEYVVGLNKQTLRDIVVVDKNKSIWADVVPANVSKKFMEDKKGEVDKTILDGQVREFVEQSVDYPKGITLTVVPLKNSSGVTVGAVIMSASHIFD